MPNSGLTFAGFAHIPGNPLIIWDGLPIYRSQVTKGFLTSGAAERIHLKRLPDYAPDLNPDGGIRNYLRRVQLKNVCCRDLAQLRIELRKAIEGLRHEKHIIKACIQQPGYVWTPTFRSVVPL